MNHLTPTQIVDKNGKRTTVHKSLVPSQRPPRTVSEPRGAAAGTRQEWESYGFQEPSEARVYTDFLEQAQERSRSEVEGLSDVQRNALSFFTSMHHKSINNALYGTEALPAEQDVDDASQGFPTLDSVNSFELQKASKNYSLKVHDRLFNDVVTNMDSAFEYANHTPRIVYRGVDTYGEYLADDGRTAEWVDENYALGSEVVIDGYQSASNDPGVGLKYANKSGVLLEMKTGSGISITDVSYYKLEDEVVLPRARRWRVVGVHHDQEFTVQMARGSKSERVTLVQMVEVDEDGDEVKGYISPPSIT